MNTVGQWLQQATAQLRSAGSSHSPELDAQILACHALALTRSRLYAFPEHPLDDDALERLNQLLHRRLDNEPVAYITGTQEFWSIPLKVDTGTLVPRADTETLVEQALTMEPLAPQGCILDLGTGSGAIAIAMAHELNKRDIIGIELSPAALRVALTNAQALGLGNLHMLRGSWLDCIADDSVAMVLANPPYLACDDSHLQQLQHEPSSALVSGAGGLEDISRIVADTVRAGRSGTPLIIEHGHQQGSSVRQMLRDQHYINVGTKHDLAGHERVSFGLVSK